MPLGLGGAPAAPAVLLLLRLCASAAPPSPTSAGHHRLLFHDDAQVAAQHGLTRRVHAASLEDATIVLQPDAPWEAGVVALSWSSVLRDPVDGKFKLWYAMNTVGCIDSKCEEQRSVGYAESADGVNFVKPVLGLMPSPFAANRTTRTNLIGLDLGLDSVWIDESAPATKRFRAQGKVHAGGIKGAPAGSIAHQTSADGLHWRLAGGWEISPCDTQSTAAYDAVRGKYVLCECGQPPCRCHPQHCDAFSDTRDGVDRRKQTRASEAETTARCVVLRPAPSTALATPGRTRP
jgi:hypothetical protein